VALTSVSLAEAARPPIPGYSASRDRNKKGIWDSWVPPSSVGGMASPQKHAPSYVGYGVKFYRSRTKVH